MFGKKDKLCLQKIKKSKYIFLNQEIRVKLSQHGKMSKSYKKVEQNTSQHSYFNHINTHLRSNTQLKLTWIQPRTTIGITPKNQQFPTFDNQTAKTKNQHKILHNYDL